jgi:hypothetical protein
MAKQSDDENVTMYFKQPDEIQFRLGVQRAFINPPMRDRVAQENFVYPADESIRINREALLDHYNMVLRDVVRLSGLSRDDAHETLQEVLQAHTVKSRVAPPR